jgi:hypothetical protein
MHLFRHRHRGNHSTLSFHHSGKKLLKISLKNLPNNMKKSPCALAGANPWHRPSGPGDARAPNGVRLSRRRHGIVLQARGHATIPISIPISIFHSHSHSHFHFHFNFTVCFACILYPLFQSMGFRYRKRSTSPLPRALEPRGT